MNSATISGGTAPPEPYTGARFDWGELVAGCHVGNIEWDARKFGPEPGSLGCRVSAHVLAEFRYVV
jgi:hypothetical protein